MSKKKKKKVVSPIKIRQNYMNKAAGIVLIAISVALIAIAVYSAAS